MRCAAALLISWVVLAAGHRGAAADFSDPGICARCHPAQAAHPSADGGHAPLLDCATCHGERRPGAFGRRHRSIPTSCTSHHATNEETHPAPSRKLKPAALRKRCLTCHDPHGSPNAHLVRTSIQVGRRLRPIEFHDAGGVVAGGFADQAMPGHGLCEVCHRETRFFPASGHGAPHYTDDCTLCHDHAAAFQPVLTDGSCTICHGGEGARLAKPSLHHDRFGNRCTSCHAEVMPGPGPGHRATAACADCHAETLVAPHTPGTLVPCTQCHDAHGSDNASLVRDVIHTTPGTDQPVHFTNFEGRVDGSFASASAPGTGPCEICHTRTTFYRADGTGAAHFTDSCIRCHPHATGFAPH